MFFFFFRSKKRFLSRTENFLSVIEIKVIFRFLRSPFEIKAIFRFFRFFRSVDTLGQNLKTTAISFFFNFLFCFKIWLNFVTKKISNFIYFQPFLIFENLSSISPSAFPTFFTPCYHDLLFL